MVETRRAQRHLPSDLLSRNEQEESRKSCWNDLITCEEWMIQPVIRRIAGQRAADHKGGRPASVQVNGVDDAILLQKVSHLPEIHPVHRNNQTRQSEARISSSAPQGRPHIPDELVASPSPSTGGWLLGFDAVMGEISSPLSNVTLLRQTPQQREVEDFLGTPLNQIIIGPIRPPCFFYRNLLVPLYLDISVNLCDRSPPFFSLSIDVEQDQSARCVVAHRRPGRRHIHKSAQNSCDGRKKRGIE